MHDNATLPNGEKAIVVERRKAFAFEIIRIGEATGLNFSNEKAMLRMFKPSDPQVLNRIRMITGRMLAHLSLVSFPDHPELAKRHLEM